MAENDDDYVYYKRGSKTMRMTRTAWKLSGGAKRKDITLVSGNAQVDTTGAKNDVSYNTLIQQAKGLEKDGLTEKAIEKYKAALQVKDTKSAKEAITRLQATLTPPDTAKLDKLIEDADTAFKSGDYGVALELYTEANAITPSDYLSAQIKNSEESLQA